MIIRCCLPCANGIDYRSTPAYQSYQALRNTDKIQFTLARCQSFNVGWNRDKCISVSTAVKQTEFDFDSVLMLDPDVSFTHENVEQLVAHGLPIVFGAYPRKNDKNEIHAGYWGNKQGLIGEYLKQSDTGIKVCDWGAGGFGLYEKRVFMDEFYPWFDDSVKITHYVDGVLCSSTCWEIHCFCLKTKYPLFVDCDCKLKHEDL